MFASAYWFTNFVRMAPRAPCPAPASTPAESAPVHDAGVRGGSRADATGKGGAGVVEVGRVSRPPGGRDSESRKLPQPSAFMVFGLSQNHKRTRLRPFSGLRIAAAWRTRNASERAHPATSFWVWIDHGRVYNSCGARPSFCDRILYGSMRLYSVRHYSAVFRTGRGRAGGGGVSVCGEGGGVGGRGAGRVARGAGRGAGGCGAPGVQSL